MVLRTDASIPDKTSAIERWDHERLLLQNKVRVNIGKTSLAAGWFDRSANCSPFRKGVVFSESENTYEFSKPNRDLWDVIHLESRGIQRGTG